MSGKEHSFHAVGVDFGTSTSLVAQRSGLSPVDVVTLGHRRKSVPSVASLRGESYVVGEDTDDLPLDQVIRSVKRAITEERATVRVGAPSGGVEVPADEVMRAILVEVSTRARTQGVELRAQPVVRLGCPAAWHRGQRQRVLDVARSAGVPVDHTTLVDEPVAAGVAWLTAQYLSSPEPVSGRLVVFDMGGGTLDIAVLDVEGGARPRVRVLASDGMAKAGDTLDEEIADSLRAQLGIDVAALPNPAMAEAALLLGARQAKERLSHRDSHPLVLPRQFFGGGVPTLRVTRTDLEELFEPQMMWAEHLLWHELRIARLTHHRGASTQDIMKTTPEQLAGDVRYVLLAGGMSNVPYVRRRMRELFPHAYVFDTASDIIAPDEAIVAGLADTVGYDGLSMHRPAFDVHLEWYYGQTPYQIGLYAAYTPLYSGWQLQNGHFALGYEFRPDPAMLPQDGVGRLRVVSTTGATIALRDDGVHPEGVDVRFGTHQMLFKLYTDGRIHLTDGAGFEHTLRADGWLPIVGPDSAPEPVLVPDPIPHYPFNREELNLPERTSWY